MAYKTIEAAREHDRLRSKDPKRREQKAAWLRMKRATDPEFKAKAYAATKVWEAEHREERNTSRAKWAKDHRFANYADAREYEFSREMKKYGTTIDWYRDKLIEQNGVCTLCGHLSRRFDKLQRLQVDHGHDCCDIKTKSCGKCLRGLLCADCNVLLSYFERFKANSTEFSFTPGSWEHKAMQYLASYRPTDIPLFDRLMTGLDEVANYLNKSTELQYWQVEQIAREFYGEIQEEAEARNMAENPTQLEKDFIW